MICYQFIDKCHTYIYFFNKLNRMNTKISTYTLNYIYIVLIVLTVWKMFWPWNVIFVLWRLLRKNAITLIAYRTDKRKISENSAQKFQEKRWENTAKGFHVTVIICTHTGVNVKLFDNCREAVAQVPYMLNTYFYCSNFLFFSKNKIFETNSKIFSVAYNIYIYI